MFTVDKYTNQNNNIVFSSMEIFKYIISKKEINPAKITFNEIGEILSDEKLNKKFDLIMILQSLRLLYVLEYLQIEMEEDTDVFK